MIQKFKKGQISSVSESFDSTRFDCKCTRPECQETLVDIRIAEALEDLLNIFPKIDIHSGFRCAARNKDVGGSPKSQHLLGRAVDIASMFASPTELYHAAEKLPVFENGGMGLYSKFIHLDSRGVRARW